MGVGSVLLKLVNIFVKIGMMKMSSMLMSMMVRLMIVIG